MVKEVDWQSKIIALLRKEGGYANKWATSLTVGVPDLITVIKDWEAAFIEVKLETNWFKNSVRTIKYTEKQCEQAAKIRAAGGVVFGLVVLHNGPTQVFLCVTRMPDVGEVMKMTRDDLLIDAYHWRTKGILIPASSVDIAAYTRGPMKLGQWLKTQYMKQTLRYTASRSILQHNPKDN